MFLAITAALLTAKAVGSLFSSSADRARAEEMKRFTRDMILATREEVKNSFQCGMIVSYGCQGIQRSPATDAQIAMSTQEILQMFDARMKETYRQLGM